MKSTLILAESNYLVREGFKTLLAGLPNFDLVAEVEHADALTLCLSQHATGVLVIDHTSAAFGVDCLSQIKTLAPEMQILCITEPKTKREISTALELGVTSYLLKDCGREEILEAIEATVKGEKFFCGKIIDGILSAADEATPAEIQMIACDGVRVSTREVEIIRLVAEGLTNKEIADRLFLSTHTVTTHRKNIMNKLGINNTAGLVLYAIRNQIIEPNKYLFSSAS